MSFVADVVQPIALLAPAPEPAAQPPGVSASGEANPHLHAPAQFRTPLVGPSDLTRCCFVVLPTAYSSRSLGAGAAPVVTS